MKRVLAAFQFLTIIPIHITGELPERDIASSSVFFPLVGFFQGAFLAAISFISLKLFSPSITSVLVIAAYLLTNGGFHQDGLSDTFDALSVKSTGDAEKDSQKRLAVMRDSTTGPIGITAIALTLLLKFILLKEVLETPGYISLNPVVFIMPVISTWSMTMMMPGARSARDDGLGRIFLGKVKAAHACLATVLLLWLSCLIYLATGRPPYDNAATSVFFFIPATLACLCAGYALRRMCTCRFGGLTGDNLGMIREITEIVLLFAAVLCF